MAYRRSMVRAKYIYEQQNRIIPSLPHSWRDDSDDQRLPINRSLESTDVKNHHFTHPFFGARSSISSSLGPKSLFQDRRIGISTGRGVVCSRSFSTGSVGDGTPADKIEIFNDVLVDKVADVAPVVSEVTVAAADSFFPVAALQYLIDCVHVYTGFDWWISIALTTLLARGVQLPPNINYLKIAPKWEAIKEEVLNRETSLAADLYEIATRMKPMLKEHGVTFFIGDLISGSVFIGFIFAINNMVEKVPSFKEGGALWFTDLTTPDTMYILPVLTALIFWIRVELSAKEVLKGDPDAGAIKTILRVIPSLIFLFTASLPKALFCHWITSNLFSLAYELVIRKPEVKKLLGIPIIPVSSTRASTNQNNRRKTK